MLSRHPQIEELSACPVVHVCQCPAFRRVTSVLDSRAGKTLTYQWSDGRRMNRLTSSDGQIVNYKYDELDRLTGVRSGPGN